MATPMQFSIPNEDLPYHRSAKFHLTFILSHLRRGRNPNPRQNTSTPLICIQPLPVRHRHILHGCLTQHHHSIPTVHNSCCMSFRSRNSTVKDSSNAVITAISTHCFSPLCRRKDTESAQNGEERQESTNFQGPVSGTITTSSLKPTPYRAA